MVVTCSELDLSTPVVAEPTIIVEVMSPKSEADDTGRKWQAYQKIVSLKHYILLSQDQRLVNVHSRAGDLWRERFLERRHRSSSTTRRSAWRSTKSTRRPTSPRSFSYGNQSPVI